jgi:hypothetical protein
MAFVSYIARRSVVESHVKDDTYDLVFEVTPETTRGVQILKNTERSLNGKIETQFFGQVETWSVQTAPLAAADAALMREFLDSTADGQSFSFDAYSMDIDTSGWAINAIRTDDGYTENRFAAIGNGGADDYFQYTFQVQSA